MPKTQICGIIINNTKHSFYFLKGWYYMSMSKAFENWAKNYVCERSVGGFNYLRYVVMLSLANDIAQLPEKERAEKLLELGVEL